MKNDLWRLAFDTLTTPGHALTFTPDAMGRISTIAVTGGSTFAYAYLEQSRQVAGVTRGNQIVANSFDSLGRLTSKTNKKAGDGTTTVNSYTYTLNNADQRTKVTFADGRHWDYTYDAAGQLTGAMLKSPADTELGTHGYVYDPMGNPLTREENGQVRTYTFNNLNQFASATVPDLTDVRGVVAPAAAEPSVKVNDVPVTVDAEGNFVREDVPLTSGPNQIVIEVKDKYNRTASVTRNVTLESAPAYTYDANGNSLLGVPPSGGLLSLTWNQENRLVKAEKSGTGILPVKLEFSYDGLGRRRTKKIFSWDDVASDWNEDPDTVLHFVYDGNNLVAELDANDTITRKYVWGADLSGTMDGAAGVGGLLAVSTTAATFYPTYDGNGNITAYVDSSDDVVYTADYTPFGKITASTGTAPAQFGFSTIYRDQETGFLAYRFRDYDPARGVWPSRDPLGEDGGINLYAMVENDPVGRWDLWGLYNYYDVPSLPAGLQESFNTDANNCSCESQGGSIRNDICCCGDKSFTTDKNCCHKNKTVKLNLNTETNYYICCHPISGIGIIRHCDLREGPCPKGDTSYKVIKNNTCNAKMDNGLPCRGATIGDIRDCAGGLGKKSPRHGYDAQPQGYSGWGSNCQSNTVERLQKCCLTTQWKPDPYGVPGNDTRLRRGFRKGLDLMLDIGDWILAQAGQ